MIEGRLIRLRPFEKSDLEACKEWINHQETATDILRVLPVSMHEHVQWYEKIIVDEHRVTFAIELLRDKRYVGNIGLRDIEWINRKGKLWVYLGKRYWNKGYGKEAVSLFSKYAFDGLNLNKIYLEVARFNEKAIGLYKSLNFEQEGILREDLYLEGKYVDVLRMSLLAKHRNAD